MNGLTKYLRFTIIAWSILTASGLPLPLFHRHESDESVVKGLPFENEMQVRHFELFHSQNSFVSSQGPDSETDWHLHWIVPGLNSTVLGQWQCQYSHDDGAPKVELHWLDSFSRDLSICFVSPSIVTVCLAVPQDHSPNRSHLLRGVSVAETRRGQLLALLGICVC